MRWNFGKDNPKSCEECYKDRYEWRDDGLMPECHICPKPSVILPENIVAWNLFEKLYDNSMPDGMTGMVLADLSNFQLFADSMSLGVDERNSVLDKLCLINRIIKQVRAKDDAESEVPPTTGKDPDELNI